jgi:hypothetical protein
MSVTPVIREAKVTLWIHWTGLPKIIGVQRFHVLSAVVKNVAVFWGYSAV